MRNLSGSSESLENHQAEYQAKAENLFMKLQQFQFSIEGKRMMEYKKMLVQIQNLEEGIISSTQRKKEKYEHILQRIHNINKQMEHQKTQNQKYLLHLNNTIDKCSKDYGRLFDRLEKERIQSQSNLSQFVDQKLALLSQKYKKDELAFNLTDSIAQMKEIKEKMKKYFDDFQREEDEMRKEFFSTLNNYREMLKEEMEDRGIEHLKNYMKEVHEGAKRNVTDLKKRRQKMQQNIIQILQNVVYKVMAVEKQRN